MTKLHHEDLPGGHSACYLDEGHKGAHLEFYGWEWVTEAKVTHEGWRASDFEEWRYP